MSTRCCANMAATEANPASPTVPAAVVVGGVAVAGTANPCWAESWPAVVLPPNAWPEGLSSTVNVIAARGTSLLHAPLRIGPAAGDNAT